MSYIVNKLEVGEHTVVETSVHPLAYIGPILVMLLTFWPARVMRLASTELALTNRRVLGKVGRVRQTTIALPPSKIDTVRVKRGPGGIMFNYGTVIVVTRERGDVVFKGISNPKEIQDKIEEAIEVAVLGHRLPRSEEEVQQAVERAKSKPSAEPVRPHEPVKIPVPVQQAAPPPPPPPPPPEPVREAEPEKARPSVVLPKEYKDPNAW